MNRPNPDALPKTGIATKEMVAEYLGVSLKTIDRMVGKGKIQKIKNLGTRIARYDAEQIRRVFSI